MSSIISDHALDARGSPFLSSWEEQLHRTIKDDGSSKVNDKCPPAKLCWEKDNPKLGRYTQKYPFCSLSSTIHNGRKSQKRAQISQKNTAFFRRLNLTFYEIFLNGRQLFIALFFHFWFTVQKNSCKSKGSFSFDR